ncbi:Aste57867_3381 [Aphanomyces stellatus]|uniref:Aste57867_3381 protein n=1 Tax=Aphanomyces stellatus TaxID=120398 RepID=A0A485KB95_9STRA|nr:hypothetical protein As57867_003371 [Aphanomyces stellatus]VFT80547.1 Aste57867_3381 [Aphanomyces stellatus]
MKNYGKIALVFHGSLFATTLGATYTCVRLGMDVRHIKIPFVNLENIDPDAGSFLLAYLVTLATARFVGPLRGGITIVTTPWIARLLKRKP